MNFIKIIFIVLIGYCFFSCSREMSQSEIETIHSNVQKYPISQLKKWHIYKRSNERTVCFYYFLHQDTSNIIYRNDGSIVGFTRYDRISFIIKGNLDTLFSIEGEKNLSFKEGIKYISTQTNISEKSIQKEFVNALNIYLELDVPEIVAYPWSKVISLQLNPYTKLLNIKEEYLKEEHLKRFIKLSPNWYYNKTEKPQSYGDS